MREMKEISRMSFISGITCQLARVRRLNDGHFFS
jgi:hypothetical protein